TIGIVIGIAALVTLALAAGYGWRGDADEQTETAPAKKAAEDEHEDEDESEEADPRGFVSLGWLYHFGYSIKTRLILLPSVLLELLPWRRRARVVALRRDP